MLAQPNEADALLNAAGMAPLQRHVADEAALRARLLSIPDPTKSSASPPPTPRYNLPVPLTPFIGRAAQSNELTARLRTTRMLTLIGPPGVGKTRLAIEAAYALREHFVDGACFAPLATVSDPALTPVVVCQALGLQESGLAAVERLQLYLRDKQLLLILDNFEQLLSPLVTGEGKGVRWITDLLAAAPGLHILITSRAPLRLRAERQFPVSPLALPDIAQAVNQATIADVAAVALFVDRAQAVQPTFAITPENALDVATLCVRLDGLPLALELVAARVKLLPPASLLARLNRRLLLNSDGLRDSTPRQQTLRNAVSWSYDLLTPAEKKLFGRLGLFVGGFTLEAVEAICNADGELGLDVLDGLASLLDKNLITQKITVDNTPRFTMLALIHEYAREQLELSAELPALQQRHAAYYLRLAEEADTHLRNTEQLAWFERLETEHDNLRTALAWSATEAGDPELGLQLVNALSWFWYVRCYYSEGSRWIDGLLAVAGEHIPPHLRAWTFSHACLLAIGLDDFARGRTMGEVGLRLARELNEPRLFAYVVGSLTSHLACQGELQPVWPLLAEAQEKLCNMADEAWMTCWLCYTRIGFHDDLHAIQSMIIEAFPLAHQVGDRWWLGHLLWLAGSSAGHAGDFTRAAQLYQESLTMAHQLHNNRSIILNLGWLTQLTYTQGELEQAERYHQAGFEVARQTGTPGFIANFLREQARLAQQRGNLAEAFTCYRQALIWVQKLGHSMFVASCFIPLAALLATQGEWSATMRLVGAAEAIYNIDNPVVTGAAKAPDFLQIIAATHARLADPLFATAWAEGQAMTLDEAIAYALALELPGEAFQKMIS
ncbi:MAG: NACHT domain-containing protein [Caldilineaceae bacterium]